MTIGRTRSGIWRQFVLWTLAAALLLIASTVLERNAWADARRRTFGRRDQEVIGRDRGRGRQRGHNGGNPRRLPRHPQFVGGHPAEENRLARATRSRGWGPARRQLGPAPAKDAPAESPEIASQRKELTEQFNDVDGELKQARVAHRSGPANWVIASPKNATRCTPTSCSRAAPAYSIRPSGPTFTAPCRSSCAASKRCLMTWSERSYPPALGSRRSHYHHCHRARDRADAMVASPAHRRAVEYAIGQGLGRAVGVRLVRDPHRRWPASQPCSH